ncbi:MAG: hypothetical protein JJU02_12995 [Cryomorphaceae bacterium]|nr:hypothetical protein [Cryomorphaceae bacterium]
MTLKAGDAEVTLDENSSSIKFSGSMRLANMKEYEQVADFLKEHGNTFDDSLVLDFENLQFLNSSGITTISLFILNCKKNGGLELTVKGSNEVSWQQKSLSNFKKLWPNIKLEMN